MNKNLILITMMIGTFMAALDGSIVNISLPAMAAQFGSTLTQIEWVVLSYMIAFAISIPLTGWLKETLGFQKLYMTSLFIFVFGSFLCGVANSLETLVIARVIQAVGGGALTPTAMAILSTIYSSRERGRAIGIWGLGVVIGPAIGPTLGGLLTAQFGWPSIFLINVPVGIVGIILAYKTLKGKELTQKVKKPFDGVGFVTLSVFIVSLLLAVHSLEDASKNLFFTLGLWVTTFLSLFAFIKLSAKNKNPLLDLKIFKNKDFVVCVLVTVARSAALYGGIFLLPFLMQTLLGFSEIKSGLLMLPGSALVAILMPFAGKWTDAHGPRNISVLGIILVSASLAVFSFVPIYATVLMILAAMALRGVGLGLLVTPISTATVNSVPHSQVTLASSLSSLFQQCGGALGIAVFALIHETALKHFTGVFPLKEGSALKISFLMSSIAILFALVPALKLPKEMRKIHESAEPFVE